MNRSVYRRDNCRLCGSDNLELVLPLTPTPVGDAYKPSDRLDQIEDTYPIELFLCKNCGLAQLLDVVNPEILYSEFIYETSISLGLVEHFQKYAGKVLSQVKPTQGSLVIDIGSNDGTLLKFFQQQSMRVLGIEPAGNIAQKATESGIQTLATFFNADLAKKIKYEYGNATIVTSNNTLANIDDLANMIEGIRDLLAPDGIFVFETGYLIDLVKHGIFDNIYHEHLSYFSVKPLVAFFRHHRMELINIEQIPTKGGSLRGIVQLDNGPRQISQSVQEMLTLETNQKADHPEFFHKFAARISDVKTQILSLLGNLKQQGKTIAGYGASVGVTTLTYHFDIGELLSFIVDDNPAKHNLFSPGYHTPVLSSSVIYDRKPDYIVILAWRYAEPIMHKHQAYLQQGGHFILLWPEVQIK